MQTVHAHPITIPTLILTLQGLICYAVVMGFMFALSDLPEVTVAIAQPLVPALALGMSAVLGIEMLSYVSLGGIVVSVAGANPQQPSLSSTPGFLSQAPHIHA